METKPFNIIRELYLKKENRNILKTLLEYIIARDRGYIVISLHEEEIKLGESMCLGCYKICRPGFYRCVGEISADFCKDCQLVHTIKYTEKCKPYIYNGIFNLKAYVYQPSISFKHSCKNGNFSTTSIMNENDSLNYLNNGIYKENIIDYINDGYEFDWSTW